MQWTVEPWVRDSYVGCFDRKEFGMNLWYLVAIIAFVLGGILTLVGGYGKWAEVSLFAGLAAFALGHVSGRTV